MSGTTLLEQVHTSTAPGPYYEPDATNAPAPRYPKVRLIAFYLPQFHPIPENDAWWGKGFTEWTNVTKALPRFFGHVQPRLPADLGFYDLRNPDVLRRQATLARRYGVGGFCFHHYWFNGRRLLEKPLERLLADPSLDFPFCVNWANENWTRRWDGLESDVLLAQAHSPEDDHNFARSLVTIVRDPRYIRVDGRPLVMIYRPGSLPEPVASMRRWRAEFARAGVGNPYIVMAQAFDEIDPRVYGVDAAAQFPPQKLAVTRSVRDELSGMDPDFRGDVVDYGEVARYAASVPAPPYRLFRTVSPSWDNEARKPGRSLILANSTPPKYGQWLAAACRSAIAESQHPDERIVFINAWNEWAEGAYLEPDRHFGHAYLAETARVLSSLDQVDPRCGVKDDRPRIALVSHDAHRHGAQLAALALARTLVLDHKVQLTVLLGGPGELTSEYAALAPTETVPGNFADMAAWRGAAQRLVASGVLTALCNTLVSAQAIRPLRETGLRVIQLVHELPSLVREYGLETAAKDAAAHAAAIVFASDYIRSRFIELAGPIRNRSVLRHQGIYLRRLSVEERRSERTAVRRALGIAADRRVVLGVGYGDVRKGLDLWPNLARRVIEACSEAVFIWVGRVDPRLHHWLDHDLRMAGLQNQVFLIGESADVAGMYAAADAYALTSREDPFPSVVIEAMASGLPTVVFEDSGGIVDLVRHAGGVSVPYLDVDAMGRELARLLLDNTAAAAMGASLAAYIDQKFDYKDYGAALLTLAVPPVLSVSVVIPNYNYARHLRQRLESIWAQRVPIHEIVLLDDASTDDSRTVITELTQESPVPIRVVWNEMNSGSVSRQWARGATLAEGDLVWIAEADDFADSDFLAVVLPKFDDAEVVMSYTESRIVAENGDMLAPNYLGYVSDISATRWTADFCRPGPIEVAEALSIKNTIPNVSAVVFRRAALVTVLHEHLEEMVAFRNVADWLCYVRLLTQGGTVAFTSRVLNNHRRHSTSVTVSATDLRHLEEIVAMQDLAASIVTVAPGTRAVAVQYRQVVADQFGVSLERVVGNSLADDAWLELLCSAAAGSKAQLRGRPLPLMPDPELQIRTVGQAGPSAMKEAWVFAAECLARFRTSPNFGDPRKTLLDFGTGWGRIARCFLRDLPAENLIGTDVDGDLLAVCRATFPGPKFLECCVLPPLAFLDESVDFVVSYSVFSHLSEAACRAWLAEFARILKPGGMVALTTRGRWFFDCAASLSGIDSYSRALSRMFPDFATAKARYDRGEFVHSNAPGVTGGGVLDNGTYGETFIPERFAREALSAILPLSEFYVGDGHPILFFKKPVKLGG